MPEPRILLSGLGIPESPRWHGGRLWFCNWIDRQVVAADMDGTAEVMLTRDPASHSMGYSIDWLPDGRLLTTGDKVRRQEPDGSMVVHAEQRASEIVVDACGNAYVNGADFDFVAGAPPKPGYIKLVTPDGQLRAQRTASATRIHGVPIGWDSLPTVRSGVLGATKKVTFGLFTVRSTIISLRT
jgi:sugar lactone lactonase YvrE